MEFFIKLQNKKIEEIKEIKEKNNINERRYKCDYL